MAQKQISDLTATDRLRTGTQLELQDPNNGTGNITIDNLLAGIQWDTPSQIAGFTSANIAEVDANTRAMHATMKTDEINLAQAGWTVGRYALSSSGVAAYDAITTTAVADALALVFGWPCTNGICVPKKVQGTFVTGIKTSTGGGVCKMEMFRLYGLSVGIGSSAGVMSPGAQGGTLFAGRVASPGLGSTGLKTVQPPSQAHIERLVRSSTQQGYLDANSMGILEGATPAAAGSSQFMNDVLYDWRIAEQPLILTPGTGFQINISAPTATTSQTIQYFVNMVWDEWTPVSPGDR